MAPTDLTRRGWRGNWLKRLLKPLAAIGVLGLLLALATPRPVPGFPQLQPAASAVQDSGAAGGPQAKGRPWYPVGDSDAGSWFKSRVGRMAYAYRTALDNLYTTNKYTTGVNYNVAIGFIDITGLDNLDTRGFQVIDATSLKQSDPALYNELGMANRPGVQKFVVVPEVNEVKQSGLNNQRETLHAEQKIIFTDLSLLSPSDGGAVFTPDRFFALYSDNTPCAGGASRPIACQASMPANTLVLYGVVYRSNGYSAQMNTYLTTARALAEADPAFAQEAADLKALRSEYGSTFSERKAQVNEEESKRRQSVSRLFHTYPAAATAAPCPPANDASNPCPSASASANAAAASDSSGNGFSQVLAQPNVAAPGGIDFSKIQLDYLSDPGDGSGLQYAFSAPSSLSDGGSASGALDSAGLASAAFFVWLELDPSADWVNLNPTEPDRIVAAQMGKTDVGRIMLQGDLALKKDVGTLIHPDSALGKTFWSELQGGCFASRVWVVPSPAQVYSTGDKLYIVKAPLNVKMEADYLQMPKGQTAAVSCPKQDPATQAHNETLYRNLVLPKLIDMVNNDASFADLRTIYRSRVAAEWYRNLSAAQHTTYKNLIDASDVSQWTTKTTWTPEQTYQQYVTSYTKGEWHVTHTENKGDYTYEYDYTYGGVDLTEVPLQQVSTATLAAEDPNLAQSVSQSLTSPTTDDSGTVTFGSPTPLQVEKAALAAQSPAVHADGSSLGITLLRWLPLLALLLLPASPLLPLAAVGVWRAGRRTQRRLDAKKNPKTPQGPHGPTWA